MPRRAVVALPPKNAVSCDAMYMKPDVTCILTVSGFVGARCAGNRSGVNDCKVRF